MFSVRDGPERERVGDGSVGATDISKFRCPGPSGSKGSARLAPVWCWSRLSMSAYPSAECKRVNINPCDSRVWECLLSCVAPCVFNFLNYLTTVVFKMQSLFYNLYDCVYD